ncbi:hypothetical protein CEXT_56471 [Caerostris extrusa]|uniref:Uncharacterized protein n=1 Tax=Caerostris extrusa TaxID=172846 RepID=A0AAV4SIU5_CAEEX|nr:hypothetical protein CEXT_56471 [Caerostris extrusa]
MITKRSGSFLRGKTPLGLCRYKKNKGSRRGGVTSGAIENKYLREKRLVLRSFLDCRPKVRENMVTVGPVLIFARYGLECSVCNEWISSLKWSKCSGKYGGDKG